MVANTQHCINQRIGTSKYRQLQCCIERLTAKQAPTKNVISSICEHVTSDSLMLHVLVAPCLTLTIYKSVWSMQSNLASNISGHKTWNTTNWAIRLLQSSSLGPTQTNTCLEVFSPTFKPSELLLAKGQHQLFSTQQWISHQTYLLV